MNTITVAGRLTRDAVTRQAGDDQVVSFSVAEDVFVNKEKTAQFFDCSFFGTRALRVLPYLSKGIPVTIAGSLTTRIHDGKTYLQIRVTDLALQGGKRDDSAPAQQAQPKQSRQVQPKDEFDDIPF